MQSTRSLRQHDARVQYGPFTKMPNKIYRAFLVLISARKKMHSLKIRIALFPRSICTRLFEKKSHFVSALLQAIRQKLSSLYLLVLRIKKALF